MSTNLFQHIIISNNIHLLCDKQQLPTTANYTLLVTKGWADIAYDGRHYHLTSQTMLFGVLGVAIDIQGLSPDWQCTILLNPTSQIDETIYACLQIEKEWHKKIQFLRSNPVLTIPISVRDQMQQYLNMLMLHSDVDNIYHQRIQYLLFQSAVFELLSWIDQQMASTHADNGASDRKQQLMLTFMQLLKGTNGTERSISWYAEHMCITTKHLQSICRATIQSTPTDIINQVAIAEIKTLLLNTNKSVKEIAADMHFSSASSFCKYFHRLTGMSALSFRELR